MQSVLVTVAATNDHQSAQIESDAKLVDISLNVQPIKNKTRALKTKSSHYPANPANYNALNYFHWWP